MALQLTSNAKSSSGTIYPAQMQTFITRVLADGGQLGDTVDLFVLCRALQDLGLTQAHIPFCAGTSLAYKLNGSNQVSKIYDLWDANSDFTPGSTGNASTSVIDASTGHPMLDMPTANTPLYAYYRTTNTVTFAGGAIGTIFRGTLDDSVSGITHIHRLETVTPTQEMDFYSSPAGDGKAQWSWQRFNPGSGIQTTQSIKNAYRARGVFGTITTSEGDFLYMDDKCVYGGRNTTPTNPTHYNGLALKATIGWTSGAPLFQHALGLWVNGTITMTQFRKLCQALSVLA